ncbi:MAG: DUF5666 domain-containing protein [Actinomycetota bacterium]|nr:DUF5666 domain-containing protein [Actinomycetota bacterium]
MTGSLPSGPPRADHTASGGDPSPGTPTFRAPTTCQSGRQRHRLASLGVLAAVAMGAAACSSATSAAASSASASAPAAKTHAHHATGPSGVVSAISPTSLVIRTKSTTSTVGLGPATTYKQGATDVPESDVVVGDHVKVRLVKSSTTPTAAFVHILPPSVTGIVGGISATGFTLSASNGATHEVTTSSATAYRSGRAAASASSIHNGDRVRVTGQASAAGSISAVTVTVLPAKAG